MLSPTLWSRFALRLDRREQRQQEIPPVHRYKLRPGGKAFPACFTKPPLCRAFFPSPALCFLWSVFSFSVTEFISMTHTHARRLTWQQTLAFVPVNTPFWNGARTKITKLHFRIPAESERAAHFLNQGSQAKDSAYKYCFCNVLHQMITFLSNHTPNRQPLRT